MLDSCRVLQDEGFEVTYLPVRENGLVDLQELEAAIRPETCLVSIMGVNNEIGVIQPLKEIGAIVKKHKGLYFHTDCAQAVGKIPLSVDECGIDLLSISAHKLYGPKGIGRPLHSPAPARPCRTHHLWWRAGAWSAVWHTRSRARRWVWRGMSTFQAGDAGELDFSLFVSYLSRHLANLDENPAKQLIKSSC